MTRIRPPAVIPDTTARDAVVAVVTGVFLLGFVIYGFVHFAHVSGRAKTATLTGSIVAKQFTPAPEQQITVGRQGLKERRSEGEYLLEVRVASEGGRIFYVPVEKSVYDNKTVGDPLTFLRPRSERR
jgi:hypothetical protein